MIVCSHSVFGSLVSVSAVVSQRRLRPGSQPGQIGNMSASEGLGRGQTADHPFPFPTTSLLASLETFLFGPRRFFTPFPPYAEPGPRLAVVDPE